MFKLLFPIVLKGWRDCTAPKNKIVDFIDFFSGQTLKVCVLDVQEVAMTAVIFPGSSGGMVVDDNGSLIGIVSRKLMADLASLCGV